MGGAEPSSFNASSNCTSEMFLVCRTILFSIKLSYPRAFDRSRSKLITSNPKMAAAHIPPHFDATWNFIYNRVATLVASFVAILADTLAANLRAAVLETYVLPSLTPATSRVSTTTLTTTANAISPINVLRSSLFLMSLNSQHPFAATFIPSGHLPLLSTYTIQDVSSSCSTIPRNSFSSTPACLARLSILLSFSPI